MSKLSFLLPKVEDLDELAKRPLGVPNFPTRPDRATRPVQLPPEQRALESAIMGKLPKVDLTHPEGTPQDGRMAAEALGMRFAKTLNDIDASFEKMEETYLYLKSKRDAFAKRVEDEGMELVELAQKQTALMARASARIDRLMEDDDDGIARGDAPATGQDEKAPAGSQGFSGSVVRGVDEGRPTE